MAATSYDLTPPVSDFTGKPRRRLALPKLRAAAIGGGFGLFVVAAGLLAIGIGWNGMAGGGGEVNGVPNLNAQLPWLVSGGILGLALVVFGAAMIVVHNARTDRARLEAKLDEVVAAMSRGGSAGIGPAYPGEPAPQLSGTYVAGGSAYHRQECRLVSGRSDVDLVTIDQATEQGLRACRVCKPTETLAKR